MKPCDDTVKLHEGKHMRDFQLINRRVTALETNRRNSIGDYVLAVMNDGRKCELYWSDCMIQILDGNVIEVEEIPNKTQNGEGLGLCRIFTVDESDED